MLQVAQVTGFYINSKRKPLYLKMQLISPNNQFSYHLKNQKIYVVSGTSHWYLYKFKTKNAFFKDAVNIPK
jgi:hypothetical protein